VDLWIENPPDPRELILAWQPPSTVPARMRWAVGKLRTDQGAFVFDYLDEAGFKDLNLGHELAELEATGFSGYPAFDLRKRPPGGYRENALQAFLRRLPPATRTDFGDYLAYFRIPRSTLMSPLALLAATEARLPSDGFSLVDPLDPTADRVELVFEIAGYRHREPVVSDLAVGETLRLEPDPANLHDPRAVQVKRGDEHVGFVNRLQAPTVNMWLATRSLECWVARLNGRAGAPRAFGFLKVRPGREARAA